MPKWSSFRDLAIMRSRSPSSAEVTLKVTGDSVFRFITWVVSACTLCHCRECCGVIFPCELVTVMMGIPIGDVDDEDDWEQMRVEIAYGTPWHGGLSTNLTSLYKQGPWVYIHCTIVHTWYSVPAVTVLSSTHFFSVSQNDKNIEKHSFLTEKVRTLSKMRNGKL